MPEIEIQDAGEHDLAQIVAIYNDAVLNSTAVFSDQPATVEGQREWLRGRRERGFPVLVARRDGQAVAFASYGEFRAWPGYRLTVEHSVYVAPDRRRQGLGARLVQELLEIARAGGNHVMIAGIDAENHPSLQMHEQLGFVITGTLPGVARKFDRWLDLVFMQITL